VPAFGLFGRIKEVAVASMSPRKAPAFAELVGRLVALGHRRIVMMARSERRLPSPGFLERWFLDLLAGHGIATSTYNLPHWEDTPEGFHRCLDSLFQHTPPTAFILDGPALFFAAQQHLAAAGFVAPRDVSLICTDQSHDFEWCLPTVAHIRWDSAPLIRRVVVWADHISRGKEDRRKTTNNARFVEGGTIGPAP
jgi:DNA-binding LacI/PurR family transcriptional regulator